MVAPRADVGNAVESAAVEGLGALDRNRRYEVVRKLGSGGMGVVYEALDHDRGHPVALKTLEHTEGEALYRFKTEFRALADVSHPNLVSLYDLFVDQEGSYFTMELVDGVDFVSYNRGAGGREADRPTGSTTTGSHGSGRRSMWDADTAQLAEGFFVDGGPPCDLDRVRETLPQLSGALAALHAGGWIHRDVKSSNVMVSRAGRVVVLDFGLAADIAGRIHTTHEPALLGTVEYMSPEQAFPIAPLSSATDWYSVGVLLYEILTGRLPFEGKVENILSRKRTSEPVPAAELVPRAPPVLLDLCSALLSRDPRRRPSGPDVLRRLGAAQAPGERSGTFRVRAPDAAPFSGRSRELAVLEGALAEVGAGATTAAILRGPSGIGKTELVREFLARAEHDYDELVVLRGRCYEREAVPYRAIDPLVDDLSRIWSELDDREAEALMPPGCASLVKLFPVLARVPVLIGARELLAIADPQEVRKRGFHALRGVLRLLGAARTLVLFLDDLQWVDRDTVVRLLELVRAPHAPRLLLLLACREDEDTDRNPHMIELADQLAVPTRHVPLAPLDRDDSIELATRLLPAEHRSAAVHIARESGGLPLFAVELAEHVQAHGGDAAPIKLDELLRARIGALTDDARTLLELVALAGEPIAQATAARAGRIDTGTLRRELHALRVAKLVRTTGGRGDDLVEPFHDRIREATVAGLTGPRRRALHGRIAIALEREGAPAQRLALHWLGAAERKRATVYGLRAARDAFDQLDFERAAELYQTVLSMGTVGADELPQLRGAVAAALTNAGRPLEAAQAFRAAAEGVPAAQRLDLYRRSAEQLLRGGYIEEGLAEMGEVMGEIGMRADVSRGRALWSIAWGLGRLRLRDLRGQVRDETQIAMEELTVVDICWSLASGLAIVEPIRGARFQLRGLHMALRLGERRRLARALALQAIYFSSQRAEGAYQRMLGRAIELGGEDLYVAGYTLLAEAAHHYFYGNRWAECVDRVDELCGVFHAELASAGWEIDTAQLYATFSMMYQGRLRELSDVLEERIADADRRAARYAAVNLRTRVGIAHLAVDAPDRAEREINDALALWVPRERAFHVQHFYAVHGLCEVALYRGEIDRADELLRGVMDEMRTSMLLRVPLVATEIDYLAARIALARARSGDERALRRARSLGKRLRRRSVPLSPPLGMLVGAGAAHLGGDDPGARQMLREAVVELDVLDTNLLAAAARWHIEDGRDEAAGWFEREGVRAPGRLAAMLLPGW